MSLEVLKDSCIDLSSRDKIDLFEVMLKQSGGELCNKKCELGMGCKYEHTFTKGLYIRKMFIPKDVVIVTQIHNTQHPFFIMQGDVSVYFEGKTTRLRAPYCGITEPGTKRALMTHEDTIWVTVHVTDKTDIEEIGKDILASSYDETKQVEEDSI